MKTPDEGTHGSALTVSMLISESVYKLVVLIERILRWFMVAIYRPGLLVFRFLHW